MGVRWRATTRGKEAAGQEKEMVRVPDPTDVSDIDIRRYASNWAPYLGFNL